MSETRRDSGGRVLGPRDPRDRRSYDERQAPTVRCHVCDVVARVRQPARWQCPFCERRPA